MTYQQAVQNLYALGHELAAALDGKPRKFDLEHMRLLMAELGNPERRFPAVLVAGTNGKGSTSATLAAILDAAAYRVGLYTSPHLVKLNERIRINGEMIADPEFTEIFTRVEAAAQKLLADGRLALHPSFFEMMTAIAFEYFASAGIEIAVLEVGLGGRLDATNVTDPCVSIITDVALDHQQWLGNTITEIAKEKAGIIRKNGILVTLPQHPEANEVIGRAAMDSGTRAVSAAQYVPNITPNAQNFDNLRPTEAQASEFARMRYFLDVMGQDIFIESPLVGMHQLRNIALAVSAAEQLSLDCGFKISPEEIKQGIRETKWPGRYQVLPGKTGEPDIILDVAHNPAGAWALRAALGRALGEMDTITLIFGAMKDKAIAEMAQILFPIATHVIATQARDVPRAATPAEIVSAYARDDVESAADLPAALASARRTTRKGAIVITGSIYLVGEALALLAPDSTL